MVAMKITPSATVPKNYFLKDNDLFQSAAAHILIFIKFFKVARCIAPSDYFRWRCLFCDPLKHSLLYE